MAGSQISTTVTSTVHLGQGGYTSPLTVTRTGDVAPAGFGPDGVTGGAGIVGAGTIVNHGSITGGSGYYHYTNPTKTGAGGVAIDGANLVTNTGTVTGGYGGGGYPYASDGGIAILLADGGMLTNTGTVVGGAGSQGYGYGGNGATGVQLDGGTISNAGLIAGGQGGYSGFDVGTVGGIGVSLSGGALSNTGTILGGAAAPVSAGSGGVGVELGAGATAVNHGVIEGGYGNYGVYATGATLTNFGQVAGGQGGIGVNATSSKITNAGTILGGTAYDGFRGDAGIFLSGGTLSNGGVVRGSAGGSASGTFSAGHGGAGVYFSGGTMLNTGLIAAGNGGDVTGGVAGDNGQDGQGGNGVDLGTGTLITSGTITAGAGGTGNQSHAAAGDAVYVYGQAGTLVVNPGAVFSGSVAALPGKADVLVLGGTLTGTLTGLGSEFTGFGNVIANPGSRWTLAGGNVLGTVTQLHVASTLTVAGSLSAQDGVFGVGRLVLDAHATLTAATSLSVASLAFAGSGALLSVGDASVTSTLSGFGAGDTIDIGHAATGLGYAGGTLTLKDHGTVVETLRFAGTYTAADFTLGADGHGGTDIHFVTGDFARPEIAAGSLAQVAPATPALASAPSGVPHPPELVAGWHTLPH